MPLPDGYELPRSILLKGTNQEHCINLRIQEILDEIYQLAGGEQECKIDLKTGKITSLNIHEDDYTNFARRNRIEQLETELKILCEEKYGESYK